MATSAELDQMIKSGELIESQNEMTPEYLRELKHTLIVSGDTELISAPAYYLAAKRAPSINAFMTGIAIIQDELAHAHIAYHILEELGEDQEKLIFSRDPKSFRYPYAFDVPLDSWTELVVANGMYDQAGFCLLGDIHDKCSYGPWKRGLNKVMAEENFHLRNGRIVAVGPNKEMDACAGKETRKLDLKGQTILPGLIDVHTHAMEWAKGVVRDQVDATYPGVKSIAALLQDVERRAKSASPGRKNGSSTVR